MPSPSLTFALLLATLYGSLAHLLLGGDGATLLFDIVTAWLGFALGQAVGLIVGITALSIGSTYVLAGTLGAVIALATKRLLARRGRSRGQTYR
jgi:uncharacterized membrane protein YeaQ/YmgE (transglycosylase-associated protein family)